MPQKKPPSAPVDRSEALIAATARALKEMRESNQTTEYRLTSEITNSRAVSIEAAEAVARAETAKVAAPMQELVTTFAMEIDDARAAVDDYLAGVEQALDDAEDGLLAVVRTYSQLREKKTVAAVLAAHIPERVGEARGRAIVCRAAAYSMRRFTMPAHSALAQGILALRGFGEPAPEVSIPAEFSAQTTLRDNLQRWSRAAGVLETLDDDTERKLQREIQYRDRVKKITEAVQTLDAVRGNAAAIVHELEAKASLSIGKNRVAAGAFDDVKEQTKRNAVALEMVVKDYAAGGVG